MVINVCVKVPALKHVQVKLVRKVLNIHQKVNRSLTLPTCTADNRGCGQATPIGKEDAIPQSNTEKGNRNAPIFRLWDGGNSRTFRKPWIHAKDGTIVPA